MTIQEDDRTFIPLAPDAERYTGINRRELRKLCREHCVEFYRKPGTKARFMILKSSLVAYMQARGHLPTLSASAEVRA